MKKSAVISLGLVLIILLSSCAVVNEIKAVSDNGNTFMAALRDVNTTASWNMLSSSLQSEMGGQAAWADWASIRNFERWTFSNTQLNNSTGQVDGEATIGNEIYTITLVFQKENNAWKISGINIVFSRNE